MSVAANVALKAVLGNDNLIAELVKGLIDAWIKENPSVWEKRKTTASDVEAGLRSLISSDLLNPEKLLGLAGLDDKVQLAKTAIKKFQSLADLDELDGIFGRISAKAFGSFRGCNERAERGERLSDNSRAKIVNDLFDGRIAAMFCFVDPGVPNLFDRQLGPRQTLDLLSDAWDLWTAHIDLKVIFVDNPVDANVIVKLGRLDGRDGGVLADAMIGGPGVLQQLTLQIDEEEKFGSQDPQKEFRAVVTHEIGHILGLRHAVSRGDLMSPFLDLNIIEPTSRDVSRMQALGWNR